MAVCASIYCFSDSAVTFKFYVNAKFHQQGALMHYCNYLVANSEKTRQVFEVSAFVYLQLKQMKLYADMQCM